MKKVKCSILKKKFEDKHTIRLKDGKDILFDLYQVVMHTLKKGDFTIKEAKEVLKTKTELNNTIKKLLLTLKKLYNGKTSSMLSKFLTKENEVNIKLHAKHSCCCNDKEHIEFITTYLEQVNCDVSKENYFSNSSNVALFEKYVKFNQINTSMLLNS